MKIFDELENNLWSNNVDTYSVEGLIELNNVSNTISKNNDIITMSLEQINNMSNIEKYLIINKASIENGISLEQQVLHINNIYNILGLDKIQTISIEGLGETISKAGEAVMKVIKKILSGIADFFKRIWNFIFGGTKVVENKAAKIKEKPKEVKKDLEVILTKANDVKKEKIKDDEKVKEEISKSLEKNKNDEKPKEISKSLEKEKNKKDEEAILQRIETGSKKLAPYLSKYHSISGIIKDLEANNKYLDDLINLMEILVKNRGYLNKENFYKYAHLNNPIVKEKIGMFDVYPKSDMIVHDFGDVGFIRFIEPKINDDEIFYTIAYRGTIRSDHESYKNVFVPTTVDEIIETGLKSIEYSKSKENIINSLISKIKKIIDELEAIKTKDETIGYHEIYKEITNDKSLDLNNNDDVRKISYFKRTCIQNISAILTAIQQKHILYSNLLKFMNDLSNVHLDLLDALTA